MDVPVRLEDDVEEGEIGPIDEYDPALECPSDDEVSQYPPRARVSSPSPPAAPPRTRTTTLRLIALRSPVLPRAHRIAVLDGHAEVSIGRDVAPAARVRLKEMAVSRFHASIYWDAARREWRIVDVGSVHGTFVRAARAPSSSRAAAPPPPGTRLSDPRKASMPRVLRHLDEVAIGGTTFLVHEHAAGRPCPDCAIDGQTDIPLFSPRAAAGSKPLPGGERSLKRKLASEDGERDAKRAMAKLKSSLLARHVPANALPPSANAAAYKDRSALRRELHPEPRVPTSHVAATRSEPPLDTVPPPRPPSPTHILLPPPPVPPSNIGHKLLLLQGWSPGTALGEDPSSGLVEPLKMSVNAPRAGLGAPIPQHGPLSQSSGDWKEEAKRRRWNGVKESDTIGGGLS